MIDDRWIENMITCEELVNTITHFLSNFHYNCMGFKIYYIERRTLFNDGMMTLSSRVDNEIHNSVDNEQLNTSTLVLP